jgi:hypothetical protein
MTIAKARGENLDECCDIEKEKHHHYLSEKPHLSTCLARARVQTSLPQKNAHHISLLLIS